MEMRKEEIKKSRESRLNELNLQRMNLNKSFENILEKIEKIKSSIAKLEIGREINSAEMEFIKEILGNIGELAAKKSTIYEIKGSRAGTSNLKNRGQIWLPSMEYQNSLGSLDSRETFMHELFHQVQYLLKPSISNIPNPVQGTGAFDLLISEQLIYDDEEKKGIDVYKFDDDLTKYNKLCDLPFLESQAEIVGIFAKYYYKDRYEGGISLDNHAYNKHIARILKNSGLNSTAIRWVLNK